MENTHASKWEVGFHLWGYSAKCIQSPELIILDRSVFMLGALGRALGEGGVLHVGPENREHLGDSVTVGLSWLRKWPC